MINVLLTFDYELPLGGIYSSYEESLFNPTRQLLELANRTSVPLNFFADVLSYQRFLEYNISEFTVPFALQLQQAWLNGHDVQLHLHPHWLDTVIKDNSFFPSEKYGLHCFDQEDTPYDISDIVAKGIGILHDILSPIRKPYDCIAYRGGGYVLSPSTQKILHALHRNGIRIDSSISSGYYFKSDRSVVDYFKVPAKANWFLNMEGDLQQEGMSQNGIFEIPIASKNKGLFEVPTSFKLKKCAHRAPENRGKMVHEKPTQMKLSDRFKALLSARMLSFDNYTYEKDFPLEILKSHVHKFYKASPIYLSVVSHPKSMGDYSFELMEYFILKAKKIYGEDITFTTFTRVKNELNL